MFANGSSSAQPPVSSSAGISLVVKAGHGSVVNVPAIINSTFSEHVSIDLHASTAQRELYQTEGAERHSDTSALQNFLQTHKLNMKKKIENIYEGKGGANSKMLLKKVYTQLYITEGELRKVNDEHEILKIDKAFKIQKSEDTPINCNEIFRLPGSFEENRLVLTKGIAGIGKTVSVQKFILDWAEGEANHSIDCMFLLPFRTIKLIKDEDYSLHEFLQEFYPDLKKWKETKVYEDLKLAFILDGLDERHQPLDFNQGMATSILKKASINTLITSLITGELLPSALVWITSRPAAANQIPSEYVSLFTEIRGFTDKQKEEYFRKRIADDHTASKIIAHVKSVRSLYIMCHIPIFCWMTTAVLQVLAQGKCKELPTTLTEMYIHFLIIQMTIKNQKYDTKVERDIKKLLETNREMILKLAKLAFVQLMKENIIFYEDDLTECGIDMGQHSEHSGMFTELLKTEFVLYERKVYCFIHLTIQEFFAALHVFYSYQSKNMEELQFFFEDNPGVDVSLEKLLKNAVNKAKDSSGGQLDLFLRFLLGISLESNQRVLQGLLTHTETSKKSISNVIQHIRHIQNKADNVSQVPPEVSISHLFCLMELKDSSLYNQIKRYLSTDKFPDKPLTASNCSALAYLLLMSEEVLEEFDVKKYSTSSAAWRRLVPVVRCSKKALLAGCELTDTCWETVSTALQAEDSVLRELDLSDNYRIQSGPQLLCDGLRSSHCKLEVLRLERCHFNQSSCSELASALKLVSPFLRELNLSNNDLQDSVVELLFAGAEKPFPKLETLRLNWCNLSEKVCSIFSRLTALRDLELSNNDLQDSGVKRLADGLQDKSCNLERLRLSGCLVTEEGCSSLASSLGSNPSSALRELDLSFNHPGDSGEKLLSDLLLPPQSRLQNLTMEPKGEEFIKPGIRKYAVQLTFDPNTANFYLLLSESNRKVSVVHQRQDYPEHPERFDTPQQVLCAQSLSRRCFWEVELRDSSPQVAVAYPMIPRKAEMDIQFGLLGQNQLSWSLCYRESLRYYEAFHNEVQTKIQLPRSDRIGVFLDWANGILSFYSVQLDADRPTPTLTHIHTYRKAFDEPVLAGFAVSDGSLTLCQLD